MPVKLKEVKESEKSILRNLYSLYLHDLSKYTSTLDIGEEGSFEYEDFDKFWIVEGISPYFIKFNHMIIGFILLVERPFLTKEIDFGVNDIFILNKYKGKGLGSQAMETLFQEKQGK
jgi:predicted acetyltransferase